MSDLRSILTNWYEKHGELTPQVVVDEARPQGAPLHDRFEWDNKIASEQYRLIQASKLIRSVRIPFTGSTGESKFVRGFHSLHEAGDPARAGYIPTEELIEDELALKLILREFERDIADIKRKYGHLKEFADMMRGAAEAS